MKEILLFSDNSWTGLTLRFTLAAIMFPHGAQKLLGMFGGYGFKPTMNYFTDSMHLPYGIALLIILIEFFSPLGLIIGLGSRVCAISILVIMVGAIITTNHQHGFFMNWFGSQKGEGYEYHLLVIGICIAIIFTGSGKLSLDRLLNH